MRDLPVHRRTRSITWASVAGSFIPRRCDRLGPQPRSTSAPRKHHGLMHRAQACRQLIFLGSRVGKMCMNEIHRRHVLRM